jgi:hypothetical protein
MRSNLLTTPPDGQLELLISAPPKRADIADEVVAVQPSLTAAINLCISASGLEDKEIYIPLKIDPVHWTRIRQGKAHFPVDQFERLMLLCGNDVPLRWLARCRGFDLMPRQDYKDKKLHDLEQQNQALRKEMETLAKYGVIKRPMSSSP